jgi:Protein of unknown function (DUF3800)
MAHSFLVYIDESGDEGFQFDEFPKGSSRWFVLSAVIVRTPDDHKIRELAASVRKTLGFPERHVLHFSRLDHHRRLCFMQAIAGAPVCVTSILVQKELIAQPEIFTEQAFRLYFYTTRLLLERVFWWCRDFAAKHRLTTPEAKLIFEHRRHLSYDNLRDYLLLLKEKSEEDEWLKFLVKGISIHWPSINPDNILSAQKNQYAGLQAADCVASGARWALERRYGNTEHRFAKTLKPIVYQRQGNYASYGLKFFPEGLPASDSRGHWIRKHFT